MDYGVQYTDKQVASLERKIKKVYKEAQKDIAEKTESFFAKYAVKDAKKQEQLLAGEITKAEYESWRKGQIFQGEQWTAKKNQIEDILANANSEALKIINGGTISVIAENANYMAYTLEHGAGVNFGFGLYDANTVTNLIKNDPDLLPERKLTNKKLNVTKDKKWNAKKITGQVTQGIIQGESLDTISKRLASVTNQDWHSMRMYARTAMTGAQNAGRQIRLEKAKDMGIKLKKEWMATFDTHTRDLHRKLDGQRVDVDKPFKVDGYEIEYPGDVKAEAFLVYNCRCTMVADLDDFPAEYKRYDNINGKQVDDMTYTEWYESKGQTHELATKTLNKAVKEEKAVTRDLKYASSLGSGHLEGLDYRFKGQESLERKISEKSAKKGISQEEYSKQITDALRYTNLSPPDTLTEDFNTIKTVLESKNYEMVEVVNTLGMETAPYRGINTLVQTPSGYTFELQFHTPQSIEIKEVNHKLYEVERLAATPEAEKERLRIEMTNNAKSIVTPTNVDTIEDVVINNPISQW